MFSHISKESCSIMRILIVLIFVTLACLSVDAASYKRGACLAMCGPFGVKCPDGYDCNSNGCGYECYRSSDYQLPPGCQALKCDYHCPVGFATDENGCDTCKCDYSALHSGTG